MTTQGIERIPDSLGYLVINEDGAVVSVSEIKSIMKLMPTVVVPFALQGLGLSNKQNSSYLT